MGKQRMVAGSPQTNPPPGVRLDSWKEISAYLKRDPRTLQRWEKKEGLPVHRHVHESQVSIYAYSSELDAWLAGRTLPVDNGVNGDAKPRLLTNRYLWFAFAILILASGLGAFVFIRRTAHPLTPATRAYRQVWAGDEADPRDAISPDGRYVSFTDQHTGDLSVRDLMLGQNRHVTNKGKTLQESIAWAWNSVFSPDGKTIAYWWLNDDRSNEIRIIGLDGQGQRTLVRDAAKTAFTLMDWSPDGGSIAAVVEHANEVDLDLISPRDGSLRVIKRGVNPRRVAFSRDGRYLAYDAPVGPNHQGDIFLISMDGREDRPLLQYPTDEFLVGWSPTGDSLIFGSNRAGSTGIWRVAFRQGKTQGDPELLKGDAGRVIPLGVTSSGTVNLLLDVSLPDVFVAELGAKDAPRRISEHFVGTRTYPSFSPDGKSLLYQSQRHSGEVSLMVRALDTGQEQAIQPALASYLRPHWVDRGRAIDVQGSDGKTQGTWRIDPRNAQAKLITEGPVRKMYKPPEGLPGPGQQIISPDGLSILAAVRNSPKGYNSLRVVPRGGGAPRELVRLKEPERFTPAFAWSPDSRWIYFARTIASEDELFRIPASGGAVESTGLHWPSIFFLSIHPDGKHIAFQGSTQNVELWALDGFLSR